MRGYASDSVTNLDANSVGNLSRMSRLKPDAKLLGFFVQQQDGEDFVIDDLADQFRHAPESGVEVKSGVDDISDLEKKRFDLGIGVSFCGSRLHVFDS